MIGFFGAAALPWCYWLSLNRVQKSQVELQQKKQKKKPCQNYDQGTLTSDVFSCYFYLPSLRYWTVFALYLLSLAFKQNVYLQNLYILVKSLKYFLFLLFKPLHCFRLQHETDWHKNIWLTSLTFIYTKFKDSTDVLYVSTSIHHLLFSGTIHIFLISFTILMACVLIFFLSGRY